MEFPQAAGGRGKIMLRVQQVELRAGRWQLLRMCCSGCLKAVGSSERRAEPTPEGSWLLVWVRVLEGRNS